MRLALLWLHEQALQCCVAVPSSLLQGAEALLEAGPHSGALQTCVTALTKALLAWLVVVFHFSLQEAETCIKVEAHVACSHAFAPRFHM